VLADAIDEWIVIQKYNSFELLVPMKDCSLKLISGWHNPRHGYHLQMKHPRTKDQNNVYDFYLQIVLATPKHQLLFPTSKWGIRAHVAGKESASFNGREGVIRLRPAGL
jgi:hypothetical protein